MLPQSWLALIDLLVLQLLPPREIALLDLIEVATTHARAHPTADVAPLVVGSSKANKRSETISRPGGRRNEAHLGLRCRPMMLSVG